MIFYFFPICKGTNKIQKLKISISLKILKRNLRAMGIFKFKCVGFLKNFKLCKFGRDGNMKRLRFENDKV